MTDDAVLRATAIAIKDGIIVWVGPAQDAARRFQARDVIEDQDAVVLPGLINAHTHVGAHFFGTLCNNANLITALYHVLFPMAHRFDDEIMFAALSIGLWDAAKGGCTTVCDHYPFPEATARAAEQIGLRALIAGEITEFALNAGPDYDPESETYEIAYVRREAEARLAQCVDFIEAWRGHALISRVSDRTPLTPCRLRCLSRSADFLRAWMSNS